MAQREKYNTRDRAYSAFHRRDSISRFVPMHKAEALAMIDTDAALWVECDDETKEPLVLIETAIDVGQDAKPATIIQRLAQRCHPTPHAWLVLYRLSADPNPADATQRDITRFRIRRLWPNPEKCWTELTPQEYAERLCAVRQIALLKLGRVA